MTAILDRPTASSKNEIAWTVPRPEIFKTNETKIGAGESHPDDERVNILPLHQTQSQLLHELAVGKPALPEIHAFCVWLHQPEQHSARLHLLMAAFPTKLRAMEFPLDDSIADWVWQHQRLLVISTEAESRFPEFARRLQTGGIKSFCAAPLMIANHRIGVFGLASTKPEAFQNSNLEFFQRGATEVTSAAKNLNGSRNPSESNERQRDDVYCPESEPCSEDNFEGIIGRSTAMGDLRKEIKVVAPTGSTVLILGETGTGKELIARAVHNLSSRRERPFIKVNCAAIPSGLIESELFGHERGAFTGAVGRRTGRFEMANGGTLFLDEIGDIPLELQPKLLRVLQEQEFERLGGTQTTRVDVRIVAATSRDLPSMVANKEFRGDLYYRLNVFPMRVPPLRERSEDIALLVRHFVDVYGKRMGKRVKDISVQAMEVLLRYSWPGNVRELQNVIERAVILSSGKILHPPLDELKQSAQKNRLEQIADNELTKFEDAAREHIIQALAATNWVLGGPRGAGARLGLARSTLIGKMRRLGISRAQA
jgi:formate hydrogenlyase transcriptional activator